MCTYEWWHFFAFEKKTLVEFLQLFLIFQQKQMKHSYVT
jgi:hypothetical protein